MTRPSPPARAAPAARLARTSSRVLLQPTPLCNLDCRYCYLPSRGLARVMSDEVADAVAGTVDSWSEHHPVTVLWHGGEPLTTGVSRLRELFDRFPPGRGHPVRHAVQTNASLIDEAWCRLFTERRIEVSVSVDGPGPGTDRVDRAGREATDRVLRGIELLKKHGIAFGAIAVVSDPSARRAAELHQWFAALGCRVLGVNLVERKGVHAGTLHDDENIAEFWAALAARGRADRRMALRDLEHAWRYVRAELAGVAGRWAGLPVDPLPMVTWDGQVVPLSPDLAGFRSARHGRFTVGDVRERGLAGCLARAEEAPWVAEALAGVDACHAVCDLFAYCRGGQAANKYFETGRLDATETLFCRNGRRLLMEGLMRDAERVAGRAHG
ncbi:cyclophane-forming radical SAM peptide maturase AmcB [Streptomyces sp. AC558_RSS880]|uniref:cyclophane-forming radical SAM peptide maturase AmcB n=1 Tax=Streptomyces sp. AC558_RSS880 TaxID=2823687 RepID=UPI001C23BBFD|nr:cyclophane-forming radical SAM peptide maturase AmcB [Streptomyces sp. AC558_RSS880]